MKITQTRLKQIIQEELAAVQEAAIDPTSAKVSGRERNKEIADARKKCVSDKTKQWDPKEISKQGSFPTKLKNACKDKVKEELAAVTAEGQGEEPRPVAMDEVGEILKAKFESDVWDLRSKGEEGNVKEVAAKLLLDYVTGHINRLEKGHLEESELEEGAGEVYCKDRRAPGGFRRQPPCPPGYDQQQIADKRGPAGGVEQSDRYRAGYRPSMWE